MNTRRAIVAIADWLIFARYHRFLRIRTDDMARMSYGFDVNPHRWRASVNAIAHFADAPNLGCCIFNFSRCGLFGKAQQPASNKLRLRGQVNPFEF